VIDSPLPHKLTQSNRDTMRGVCAACGPVELHSNGPARPLVCINAFRSRRSSNIRNRIQEEAWIEDGLREVGAYVDRIDRDRAKTRSCISPGCEMRPMFVVRTGASVTRYDMCRRHARILVDVLLREHERQNA
jgi:hypothetical protein